MGHLKDYIIRRILISIPTLLGVSIITFTIIHLAPGGPLNFMLETAYDISPEIIEYLKQQMGLDQPLHIQYLIWLKNILTGNLGKSYINQLPIAELIGSYWNYTFRLSLGSLIISSLISIPLGVISAVKKDSIIDNVSRLIALLGVSMPNFWMALLAILLFAVRFPIFPIYGAQTIGLVNTDVFSVLTDQIWHLILPMCVMAFGGMAMMTRLVRSSMLEVLNQEYIQTARAKGVKERMVIFKHGLRNALLPVVTMVGLEMSFLLSGAVTLETVFSWPGIGRFVVLSTFNRDYPAIMAMTMIVSAMVIISTLITDVVYAFLDPRIRY